MLSILDQSKNLSVGKEALLNHLTLSQTTNFRLFRTERGCRRQIQIDKNCGKFSTSVENTVGKGEIARYEQFCLFPQGFLKTFTADT